MSILRDYQKAVIQDLRGPWPLLEAGDVPATNALQAQNVEYLPGLVKGRFGFLTTGLTLNPTLSRPVGSMLNWLLRASGSTLDVLASVYAIDSANSLNLVMTNLANSVSQTAATSMPFVRPIAGASMAVAGPRLYWTGYDILGLNSAFRLGAQVQINYSGSSPGITVPLFNSYNDLTISAADTGSGTITAGPHSLLVLETTSAGFTGFPEPYSVPASGFPINPLISQPATWTAGGGAQAFIYLNPNTTWTNTGGITRQVQVMMTRADNPARWYIVPGTLTTLPTSGSSTVVIQINISDDILAATGEDGTPWFSVVTLPPSGTTFAPVLPTVIAPYNNRMVFIATEPSTITFTDNTGLPVAYVSDEDDYQHITLDQHAIYLPGQQQITTCFTLNQSLFLVGPHWTYFSQDTGDVPITWPTPALVDASIGTLSPSGATVNGSKGFAWVADTNGLYLFAGGAYSPRPISYYQQPIWARINWAAAPTVQVVDNSELKRVYVLAPLDGATTPNYILVWDYTRGLDPEDVNFSLDSISGQNIAAMATVQNPTTSHIETWLMPTSVVQPVLRYGSAADANPYRDNGNPIVSLYQTSLIPELGAEVYQHHGDHMRLQGAGLLNITAQTLDGGRSLTLDQVLDGTSPAQLFLRKYHAISEAMSLTFSTAALDTWFQLSEITHYYTSYLAQRS